MNDHQAITDRGWEIYTRCKKHGDQENYERKKLLGALHRVIRGPVKQASLTSEELEEYTEEAGKKYVIFIKELYNEEMT